MATTHLLIYRPIKASKGDWRPLLQQQAVLAASRAVAAHREALLAPTHPDVVTLLATTAPDRAQADPPRPVHLYGELEPSIRPLLDQRGWFGRLDRSFGTAVQRQPLQSCIILGDAQCVLENMESAPVPAQRVIYLRALTGPDFPTSARAIAADADQDFYVGGGPAEGPTATPWSFREDRPALEPFIAFGLAFERALWNAGRPG